MLFFLLFFIYPLGSIFDVSLRPEGQWDFSGFVRIVNSDYYRDTFLFTIWQAFLSTLLTLVLALPSAYIFAHYRFFGKTLWLSLATVPFVLPTVVVAMAFSSLIGDRGIVNQFLMHLFNTEQIPIPLQNTLFMVLLAHVFYNYAVALRMIAGYWINVAPQYEESAKILGASGWRLWWYIYFPLLNPVIIASSLLVFIFTFTSFGVVLILGGIRFATLEVQIYYQALNIFDLPMAAALSLVQMIFMFGMMVLYTRLQRSVPTSLQSARLLSVAKTLWQKIQVRGIILSMSFLLFTPLFALILRALNFNGPHLFQYFSMLFANDNESILFVPPYIAIANSLFFAVITMLIALVMGTILSYLIARRQKYYGSHLLDALVMLPLATSAVTLGFGYIIALDEPPLNLRTSWILIPLAHTLVAIPFVVRSVLPALRAIPNNLTESARILGARDWQVIWHIERPLISRAMTVGAIFAFTVSMGEFGASLFIARPDTPTLPIAIFRLLGQPGSTNYGQAVALSVILMLVCMASFAVIERTRTVGIGEF